MLKERGDDMKKALAGFLTCLMIINLFSFAVFASDIVHELSNTTSITVNEYSDSYNVVSSSSSNVNLVNEGYVTYMVKAPSNGVYNLSIYVRGFYYECELEPAIEVIVNDVSHKKLTVGESGWVTLDTEGVELTEGTNTVRLKVDNNVYINTLTLSRDTKTDEFMSRLSSSKSVNDIKSIIEGSEYFEGREEEVFYKNSLYSRMLINKNLPHLSDVIESWNTVVDTVKANPDVELLCKIGNVTYDYKNHADSIAVYNNPSNGNTAGGMESGLNVGAKAFFTTDVPNGKYRVEVMAATQNDSAKLQGYLAKENADFTMPFTEGNVSVHNLDWFTFSSLTLGTVEITDERKIIGFVVNDGIARVSSITLIPIDGYTDMGVTAPQKGLHKIKLSADMISDISVIAAMYEGNSLLEAVQTVTNGQEQILEFTKPVTGDSAECKVFFWNNINDLKPVDFAEVLGLNRNNIYVAPHGSDTGLGTEASPFRTLGRAKECARSLSSSMSDDIIINIAPGNYYLDEKLVFTPGDSGTNGYDIIYRGVGDTKPLISGGVKLGNNWADTDCDGIYEITVPEVSDARQMYVDGFSRQRAKSDKLYLPDEAIYDKPSNEYSYDGIIVTSYDLPEFAHPEDLEIVAHIQWSMLRMAVDDVMYRDETDDTVFVMKQPAFESYCKVGAKSAIQPKTGYRFYLENALELLDEEGEFYFDKSQKRLYYKPFEDENLETAEIYLPKTEGMISLVGLSDNKISNIRFENLDFRHGAFNEATTNGVVCIQADCRVDPTNPKIQWGSDTGITMPSQIYMENADNIDIYGCNFQNLGSAAIGMVHNVSSSEVIENTIHDISGTSVIVGNWRYSVTDNPNTLCNGITIKNNIIKRTGQEFTNSPALSVYYAKNIDVLHNDISYAPYTGITLGWGWGSSVPTKLGCGNYTVEGNKISDTSLVQRDGGDIYTLGDLSGTVIQKNHLVANNDMASIYLDQYTQNISVRNNVMEDYSGRWLYINVGADSNTITDNYVDSNVYEITSTSQSNPSGTKVFSTDNWTGNALTVYQNAGLEDSVSHAVPDYPQKLGDLFCHIPSEEQCDSGDYVLEAEDYTASYPSAYSKGEPDRGRYIVSMSKSNYSSRYLEYTFNVAKAGTYRLEGRMYSTSDISLDITVNGSKYTYSKSANYIAYGLCPSINLGEITLNQGQNTIRIANGGAGSVTVDSFKLRFMN